MVTYAKISPKTLNPRDLAGNAEEGTLACLCQNPLPFFPLLGYCLGGLVVRHLPQEQETGD